MGAAFRLSQAERQLSCQWSVTPTFPERCKLAHSCSKAFKGPRHTYFALQRSSTAQSPRDCITEHTSWTALWIAWGSSWLLMHHIRPKPEPFWDSDAHVLVFSQHETMTS